MIQLIYSQLTGRVVQPPTVGVDPTARQGADPSFMGPNASTLLGQRIKESEMSTTLIDQKAAQSRAKAILDEHESNLNANRPEQPSRMASMSGYKGSAAAAHAPRRDEACRAGDRDPVRRALPGGAPRTPARTPARSSPSAPPPHPRTPPPAPHPPPRHLHPPTLRTPLRPSYPQPPVCTRLAFFSSSPEATPRRGLVEPRPHSPPATTACPPPAATQLHRTHNCTTAAPAPGPAPAPAPRRTASLDYRRRNPAVTLTLTLTLTTYYDRCGSSPSSATSPSSAPPATPRTRRVP